MAARHPSGGRGSNQYQVKGHPTGATSHDSPPIGAVESVEDDTEEIGWAFLPNREEWEGVGLPTWKEANPWMSNGFTPSDAAQWIDAGIRDPMVASQWRDASFSPPVASHWSAWGFTPSETKVWLAAGVQPEWASDWRDRGFSPDESVRWHYTSWLAPSAGTSSLTGKSHSFTPDEVSPFRAAGYDPERAFRFYVVQLHFGGDPLGRDHGVPSMALRPRDAGNRSDYRAHRKRWRQSGFTLWRYARPWVEHGLTPQESAVWQYANFTAEQAASWLNRGIGLDDAIAWRRLEASPAAAQEWRSNGFTSPNYAAPFMGGCSPEEAADRIKSGTPTATQ